eukprot:660088-Pleurochrysis_carterae.AAC.2
MRCVCLRVAGRGRKRCTPTDPVQYGAHRRQVGRGIRRRRRLRWRKTARPKKEGGIEIAENKAAVAA